MRVKSLALELEKLPDEQQNAIATRLLAEFKYEKAWATHFEATTNEQWDKLASMGCQEIAKC